MIGTCEACGRQGVRVHERASYDIFAPTPTRVVRCVDTTSCLDAARAAQPDADEGEGCERA